LSEVWLLNFLRWSHYVPSFVQIAAMCFHSFVRKTANHLCTTLSVRRIHGTRGPSVFDTVGLCNIVFRLVSFPESWRLMLFIFLDRTNIFLDMKVAFFSHKG
jgi:hypothetical protein